MWDTSQIYPWIVYTDEDISEESKRNKYKEEHPLDSPNLCTKIGNQFEAYFHHYSQNWTQWKLYFSSNMKNAQPSQPEDRLGIFITICYPPPKGEGTNLFLINFFLDN